MFLLLLIIFAGTIWLQQILSLIEVKGDVTATINQLNSERVPWIELLDSRKQFVSAPSPRICVSHLPYKFMPVGLKQKKGKVSSLPSVWLQWNNHVLNNYDCCLLLQYCMCGLLKSIANVNIISSLFLMTNRSSMWPEIQRMFWCLTTTFTNTQICWRPQKTLIHFLRNSWKEMVNKMLFFFF